MIVAAIDTSTPTVVCGLFDTERAEVLAERHVDNARAHAEILAPLLIECLADSGVCRQELGGVVVGCGPGPFTGLRVGMATGAALADGLEIPSFGVCSVDGIGVRTSGNVLVVTDARRKEVYWAIYRDGVRIQGPDVGRAETIDVTGIDAVAGSSAHAAIVSLPIIEPEAPTVSALVQVAMPQIAGHAPAGALIPLYLRRPDAVEPKNIPQL